MRPIKLTMSAFGPFANETVVNLEQLGEHGLYLVTGDTGTGKTTMFDAITFALYGKASGDQRDPSMFRSKYAEPAVPTFVELVFRYGSDVYTVRRIPEYDRPAKRGDKMTKQRTEATLVYPDGKVLTKTNEVTAAVTDLIGLDRDQFVRIAMIAQGDFLKLLLATTEERKKIFQQLFQTQRYEQLQNRLKADAQQLREQCSAVSALIAQRIQQLQWSTQSQTIPSVWMSDLQDQLKSQINADLQDDAAAQLQMKILEETLSETSRKIGQAEEVDKLRSACLDTKNRLEAERLKRGTLEKQLQEAEADLQQTETFGETVAVLRSLLPQYDELDVTTNTIRSLKESLSLYEQRLHMQRQTSERQSSLLEQHKIELEQLADCEACAERAGRKIDEIQRKLDTLTELRDLEKNCTELTERLNREQKSFMDDRRNLEASRAAYEQLERNFLDAQAGLLAGTLKEGMPCPVCGSLDHPAPAVCSFEAPTEEALKRAKNNLEASRKQAEQSSSACAKTAALLEMRQKELDQKTPDQWSIEPLFLEDTWMQLSKEKKEVYGRLQIEKDRIERKKALEKKLPELIETEKLLQETLRNLEQQVMQIQGELQLETRTVQRLSEGLPYADRDTAWNRMRDLEKQRQTAVNNYESAEKSLQSSVTRTAALEEQLFQLNEQIAQAPELCAETERKKRLEFRKLQEQLQEKRNLLQYRIRSNQESETYLREQSEKLKILENRYQWMKTLSDTANGTLSGQEKIMLETYIQMHYFDRIIGKANVRLLQMTDGQYELVRRTAGDMKSQSGLDLDVIDHYNGTHRSVRTLSGGESFQASLCLALGLSDEVQASAGGIRLDTLFVDEGFGSLDEDALQQALAALDGLAQGNRLVGIISHVADLKDRIEKQILVTKDKTGGSKIRICT